MRCAHTEKCGHRFTLKKKPYFDGHDFYKTKRSKSPINCEHCGGRVRSDEKNRKNEMAKKESCFCKFIPFRHKKAEFLGCEHHPLPFEDWTENHHQQFQSMLEVHRGG